MLMSKKCQYALRAVFELGLRDSGQPVKIHEIAGAQDIPARFLEVILNQLRHAGFVESQRGSEGGYMLGRKAKDLTVGEVIQCVQGPISVTHDGARRPERGNYFYGDYAFKQLWQRVSSAISQVWDNTTFAELIEYENAKKTTAMPDYVI